MTPRAHGAEGSFARRALPLCALAALACTAAIQDGQDNEPGGMPPASGGVPGGVSPGSTLGAPALRRLSHTEYLRSVEKLTGVATAGYAAQLLHEGLMNGFDNQASVLQVTFDGLSAYQRVAEDVAGKALATAAGRARLFPGCEPLAAGCLDAAASRLGRLFFRRPLAADELQALRAAAFDGAGQLAADGQRAVLEILLAAPQFLYRTEIGAVAEDRPGAARLTPHEIAAALAFGLWQETPDAALLDEADAGGLADAASVERAVRSMAADARAAATFERFAALYLRAPAAEAAAIPSAVAGYDAAVKAAALEELARLIRDYFGGDADVVELFRTPYTYVNDRLAAVYGYPTGGGATFRRVDAPAGADRRGLFGTSAFFLATAKGDRPNLVHQGEFVRAKVLCDHISPPPPSLQDEIANDPSSASPEARLTKPVCAACHRQLDLIGMGLSAYGVYGQRLPGAAPGQGTIEGLPGGEFSGPAALGDKVVATGRVGRCVAENLATWLLGRGVVSADDALVARMDAALAAAKNRVREMLPAYFTSDAFLYREVAR